jgi:hypothetical protein
MSPRSINQHVELMGNAIGCRKMQAHALWRQVADGAFELGAVLSDKYCCVFENALAPLRSSFCRAMHCG